MNKAKTLFIRILIYTLEVKVMIW